MELAEHIFFLKFNFYKTDYPPSSCRHACTGLPYRTYESPRAPLGPCSEERNQSLGRAEPSRIPRSRVSSSARVSLPERLSPTLELLPVLTAALCIASTPARVTCSMCTHCKATLVPMLPECNAMAFGRLSMAHPLRSVPEVGCSLWALDHCTPTCEVLTVSPCEQGEHWRPRGMMGEGGLDSRGVPAGTPTATRAAGAPVRDTDPSGRLRSRQSFYPGPTAETATRCA